MKQRLDRLLVEQNLAPSVKGLRHLYGRKSKGRRTARGKIRSYDQQRITFGISGHGPALCEPGGVKLQLHLNILTLIPEVLSHGYWFFNRRVYRLPDQIRSEKFFAVDVGYGHLPGNSSRPSCGVAGTHKHSPS
ncbi:MAG: hypothetical protein Ct9H300mP28_13000 [Pseudomonadota bacterium]|nr:MAG: hypothetical protein Ct9H300mP28_13000 [Pseudomonadota bacterium]